MTEKRYNPPEIIYETRSNGSLKISRRSTTPGRVQQQFKDSVDINKIMKRYHSGGRMTNLSNRPAVYGDFSNVTDYASALRAIQNSQDSFMNLPSQIRSRFENDPAKLLDFLSNKNNRDEAIKLGLIKEQTVTQNDDSTTNAKTKAPPKTKTPPVPTEPEE